MTRPLDPVEHALLAQLGSERRGFAAAANMSSEQIRGLPLTPATDVFSLAVLLATLALGRHPLPRRNNDYETCVAIRDHAYQLPGDTPLLRLLRTVIVPDPASRPTARELAAALAALG